MGFWPFRRRPQGPDASSAPAEPAPPDPTVSADSAVAAVAADDASPSPGAAPVVASAPPSDLGHAAVAQQTAEPGWASLPALQRTSGSLQTLTDPHFADSLTSWSSPMVLAPLGHAVSWDAPAGEVHGIAPAAASVSQPSDPAPLPLAVAPPPRPAVQRTVAAPLATPAIATAATPTLHEAAAHEAAAHEAAAHEAAAHEAAAPVAPPAAKGPAGTLDVPVLPAVVVPQLPSAAVEQAASPTGEPEAASPVDADHGGDGAAPLLGERTQLTTAPIVQTEASEGASPAASVQPARSQAETDGASSGPTAGLPLASATGSAPSVQRSVATPAPRPVSAPLAEVASATGDLATPAEPTAGEPFTLPPAASPGPTTFGPGADLSDAAAPPSATAGPSGFLPPANPEVSGPRRPGLGEPLSPDELPPVVHRLLGDRGLGGPAAPPDSSAPAPPDSSTGGVPSMPVVGAPQPEAIGGDPPSAAPLPVATSLADQPAGLQQPASSGDGWSPAGAVAPTLQPELDHRDDGPAVQREQAEAPLPADPLPERPLTGEQPLSSVLVPWPTDDEATGATSNAADLALPLPLAQQAPGAEPAPAANGEPAVPASERTTVPPAAVQRDASAAGPAAGDSSLSLSTQRPAVGHADLGQRPLISADTLPAISRLAEGVADHGRADGASPSPLADTPSVPGSPLPVAQRSPSPASAEATGESGRPILAGGPALPVTQRSVSGASGEVSEESRRPVTAAGMTAPGSGELSLPVAASGPVPAAQREAGGASVAPLVGGADLADGPAPPLTVAFDPAPADLAPPVQRAQAGGDLPLVEAEPPAAPVAGWAEQAATGLPWVDAPSVAEPANATWDGSTGSAGSAGLVGQAPLGHFAPPGLPLGVAGSGGTGTNPLAGPVAQRSAGSTPPLVESGRAAPTSPAGPSGPGQGSTSDLALAARPGDGFAAAERNRADVQAALDAGVVQRLADGSYSFSAPEPSPQPQPAVAPPADGGGGDGQPAVQRDPSQPPAAVPVGASSGGGGQGGGAHEMASGELDELARRLYARLRVQLQRELRLDRERIGGITGGRR